MKTLLIYARKRESIKVLNKLFRYRKKGITIQTFLDSVRELAEEQFYNIAMRQKLMAIASGINSN